ncbi:MAG: citrate lyase subunit alpha [Christensenellaceae bacterium]|nr:citrate lyase subunit alpha [Christensenellaceae bacterium]
MKNSVGREIPRELIEQGWQPYQGKDAYNGTEFQKVGPKIKVADQGSEEKVLNSIEEAIRACGLKDGMTLSFHHHFRDGDYIVETVMREIVRLGFRDMKLACSSIGSAAPIVADCIETGVVTGLTTSGIRDRIGEAVSHGKLKDIAILRTHGGRIRAIEQGKIHIDVAFVGAPSCDAYGNASGKGGKSNCGSLSYAEIDVMYADQVVVITDTLVPFPNKPSHIEGIYVDYVVEVNEIGNPKKIASAAARMTTNPKDLMIAEDCVRVMRALPYFVDGFSFQTGVGGPSIATTIFLREHLKELGIKIGWIVGGVSTHMVNLMKEGLVGCIADVQDFDLGAIESLGTDPRHFDISVSEYANPFNKGAFINKLDFVILSALEIDTDFNVNVLTGSDGVLRGAAGGHPDTAACAKCCIIVTPLVRGRIPTVCDRVVTVTTAGDSIDVLVTDHGIAVNPLRQDLIKHLNAAGIEHVDIHTLRDKAYSIVGQPDDIQFEDRVVAIVEARDGTVMDVVRQVKPFSISED